MGHLEPVARASIYEVTLPIWAHWRVGSTAAAASEAPDPAMQDNLLLCGRGGSSCSPPLPTAPRTLHLPLPWRTAPSRPLAVGEAGEGAPDPTSLRRPLSSGPARDVPPVRPLFIDFNVATHFLCPVGDPGDDASCFANPLFQLNRHHHHTTTFVAGPLDARRRP
jgi:hypothetical protein